MKAKMFEFCAAKNKNEDLVAVGRAAAQKDKDRKYYKENLRHIKRLEEQLETFQRKLALAIRNNDGLEMTYFGICRREAKALIQQLRRENQLLDKKYLPF